VSHPQLPAPGVRVAALPWYDLPQLREATDALWHGIARELVQRGVRDVPQRLERDLDPDQLLERPDLLLSQTCGTMVGARPGLRAVATPRYSAPGCRGSEYASFVVVPDHSTARSIEDLRGARCALNDPRSHSGANCLRALIAPLQRHGRFFSSVEQSGSHLQSLAWLAGGRADVAAIDCVTFALARQVQPDLTEGVRVLCTTPTAPAPPFVAGPAIGERELGLLRHALRSFLGSAASAELRESLRLDGIEVRPLADYAPMAAAARQARMRGYREL
jgi:ABC-type phosphate/phosphonate transport system substrate-binding protein